MGILKNYCIFAALKSHGSGIGGVIVKNKLLSGGDVAGYFLLAVFVWHHSIILLASSNPAWQTL